MPRKYTDQELSKAMLMIAEQGMQISEVSRRTSINYRTLYRYQDRYLKGKIPNKQDKKNNEVVIYKENPVADSEMQQKVDQAILERARFQEDLFRVKQLVLSKIERTIQGKVSLDSLQKTLRTITDLETVENEQEENPAKHSGTVNMYNFFNQKLIDEGYEGPELTDADIVEGD